MTRTTFFSLAAVAMIATACERHPASELGEEGETAGHVAEPAEAPSNPAGAAPVAVSADEKAPMPAPAAATPAAEKGPEFFPKK